MSMNEQRRQWRRTASVVLGVIAAAACIPAARSDAAPKATGQPTISGRATEGNVLTASTGSFSGTGPFNYTYRWLRCPASGSGGNGEGCSVISGATFRRYTVRHVDVGHRLRVRVTAANSEGSATGTSNATGIVQSASAAGPARNTAPPTISGTPQAGQTLTASNGTWVGAQPTSFAYQWRRCDASGGSCSDIGNATGKTYKLTTADQGTTVRVRVTGRNARGSSSATSAPTAVVAKAEAPGGSTVSVTEVSLPNRLVIDQYSFGPSRLRRHGRLIARFHVSDTRSHSVMGALVFVEGVPLGQVAPSHAEAPTASDGWVSFNIRASSRLQLRGANRYAFFLRARKPGEDPLGGVSARRLVAVRLG
jgi:hypothetical protein